MTEWIYRLIVAVRTTRARVIYLRNDYKDLMARIERGLHAHHASAAEAQSRRSNVGGSSTNTDHDSMTSSVVETPFAKVNAIVPGSPAEQAGLKMGDEIQRFGHVTWMNHEKLSKIAETVQRNEGVSKIRIVDGATTSNFVPANDPSQGVKEDDRWTGSPGVGVAIDATEWMGWSWSTRLSSSSIMSEFCSENSPELGFSCIPWCYEPLALSQ